MGFACRGFVDQEVAQSSQWHFHQLRLTRSVTLNSCHVQTPFLPFVFQIEGFGLDAAAVCHPMIFGFLKEAVELDLNPLHLLGRDFDYLLQHRMESLRHYQDKLSTSSLCFGAGLGSVKVVLISGRSRVLL